MGHSESYRRILNKLGYYNYQQGIIYRHLRQGSGWDTHLKNCRRFILKGLDYYKPRTMTVLGSGWLLDLPLAEILETTDSVTLIDIVHPPEVKNQVTGLNKVHLLEMDLTGGLIKEIWEKVPGRSLFGKPWSIENLRIPELELPFDTGMVISLNILTQLEVLLLEFLKKKVRMTQKESQLIRKEIQQKHVNFLVRNKSLLITDTSEVFTDQSNNVTDIQSVIIDLPGGLCREEWTWHFDLKRSDYYEKRSVYKVAAILLG